MSTKNDKYSFIEQSFTGSENLYYNLNINQSKKCAILIPVQSYSKPNNDKYCGKKIAAAVQKNPATIISC
jgi:hypothetical protein|uniref:Uncharacterized protein n=1 Tax=Panagrolaimus sp. PS1159 TaxID=55785 RepID=A0AC35G8U3_9BILA